MGQIEEAVKVLTAGGVVIFPTDTVWGIGASLMSSEGIEKLYSLKHRKNDKPTAILVGSLEQAQSYGKFSKNALKLVEKHWPGALTVVVKANDVVSKKILNEKGGVGIRFADSEVVNQLCSRLNSGLVASSANLSGEKAPRKIEEVDVELKSSVDMVIDEKEMGDGLSSTVVDCMGEKIKILREGGVKL